MSAYGQLRERYQAWLSKERLSNQSPEELIVQRIVTAAQHEELLQWAKEFAAVGDT